MFCSKFEETPNLNAIKITAHILSAFLLKFLLSSSKFERCGAITAGIHFALPYALKASFTIK